MEKSPSWEADSRAGGEDITRSVDKSLAIEYIPREINPINIRTLFRQGNC
jgi:hypothetical protein